MDQDAILIEIAELARQFARRIVQKADAHDLAQDVVLKCMARMRTTNLPTDKKPLRAFVRRMVVRRAIDERRVDLHRAERDAEHLRDLGDGDREWMSADSRVDAEALSQIHEKALARLPETCRRAYVMVREERISYKEAAERLGISRSAVNWHLVQAHRRIRTQFAAHGIAVPLRRTRADACRNPRPRPNRLTRV